jgi:hypothetical protein
MAAKDRKEDFDFPFTDFAFFCANRHYSWALVLPGSIPNS